MTKGSKVHEWNMNMEQWNDDDDDDDDDGGILKHLQKTWHSATLSTKNPKWTVLEMNPGLSELLT